MVGPLVPYNDSDAALAAGPWGLSTSVPPGMAVPGSATPAPGLVGVVPTSASAAPYLTGDSSLTDGHPAQLRIQPRRIVAPVGREVVLLAGLCGEDGYYVTSQPVEWSISPDSVGSIVEVDQVGKPLWRHYLRKSPRKFSGQYAVGRTSCREQVLPRGGPDASDDIQVAEGQTWISVSSATEGATQLTAVASTAAGWEGRRDAATIYWVDGQWELPPPAIGTAAGAVLNTRVTRATSNLPIQGWRVRYEITGGTPAAFDAAGAQSTEVESNSDGLAGATLVPLGGYSGATQVRVQVIRVGTSAGDLPKLVVGEGTTTVTWSLEGTASPGTPATPVVPVVPESPVAPATVPPRLTVRIEGPAQAEPDATVTYQITATNVGTATIEGVEVVNELPRELQFLRSAPQGGEFGSSMRWQMGGILPGDSRAITVDYRVTGGGLIRNCVKATSGSVVAEDCATMEVRSNALAVDLRGPEQASVGGTAAFEIVVTNFTNRTLEGLVLEDTFDAGLENSRGVSPLQWNAGSLGPNQTQSFPIRFTVRQAGRLCHEVKVRANDGSLASDSSCLEATAPQTTPGTTSATVQVEWRGPERTQVGRRDEFSIIATNSGTQPLTNVRLQAFFDPAWLPREARPAATPIAGGVEWQVTYLAPGTQATVMIRADAASAHARACARAVATSAEGVRGEREFCVEIAGPQGSPSGSAGPEITPPVLPPDNPGPPNTPPVLPPGTIPATPQYQPPASASGRELSLQVTQPGSPFGSLPGELTYVIDVGNQSTRTHNSVQLRVALPQGTEYLRGQMPPGIGAQTDNSNPQQLNFQPVQSLRPGERLQFQIVVRQTGPTIGPLRADVSSQEDRIPVSTSG